MCWCLSCWGNENNSEAGVRTCQALEHQAQRLSLCWFLQPSPTCLTCCSTLSSDNDELLLFSPPLCSLEHRREKSKFLLAVILRSKMFFCQEKNGIKEERSRHLLHKGHPMPPFPHSLLEVAELQSRTGYTHCFLHFSLYLGLFSSLCSSSSGTKQLLQQEQSTSQPYLSV